MTTPNKTLTQIYGSERIFSMELTNLHRIDFKLLKTLKFSYLAVIWLGPCKTPVDEMTNIALAKDLINQGYTVVLHIGGRNNTKASVTEVLNYAKQIGVRNLMVVRGATPDCKIAGRKYDFPHAPDLIKFIKANHGDYFDLVVAGYPYRHPESKDFEDDMKYLKEKNDAGANYILTQAAFSFDIYKEFLFNCRKYKINSRIIPGVYVIRSHMDFCFLQKLCKIPQHDPIVLQMEKIQGDEKELAAFGLKTSAEIVKRLLDDGDFCPPHIYTMDDITCFKELTELIYE